MKRPQFLILPLYWTGLVCMVLSCQLMSVLYGKFPVLETLWLLPGAALMICALGFHGANRRSSLKYTASFFLNSAAYGVTLCALVGAVPSASLTNLLLALTPAAALSVFLWFLLMITGARWQKALTVVFSVLSLCLIGLGLFVFEGTPMILTVVFTSLFSLAFSIGVPQLAQKPEETFHMLSYIGLGAFALIALIVMFFTDDNVRGPIFHNLNPFRRKKNWKQEMEKRKK